jgi:hypothetical protein
MPQPALCRLFRSRWQAFKQQLWPDTDQERTERELDRLKVELSRRYRRLLLRRCRIERVQGRLTKQEQRIDELTRQTLGACGEQTLELEDTIQHLQRSAQRNRDRLRDHEDAYRLQLAMLERKKHLHLAMLRGDVVPLAPKDGE